MVSSIKDGPLVGTDDLIRSICELIVNSCMAAKGESGDDRIPPGLVEELFDQYSPSFPKLTLAMIEDACAQRDNISSSGGASDRASEEGSSSPVARAAPQIMPEEKCTIAWTTEEDDQLREAVSVNSKGKKICWFDVAVRLPGRTDEHCHKRWADLKKRAEGDGDCKDKDKFERWTDEEDQLIISSQAKFGDQWAEIGKRLEGRTASSIEARWHRVLKRKVESYKAKDHGELKFATFVSHKQPAEQSSDEDNAGISPKTTTTKTIEQWSAKIGAEDGNCGGQGKAEGGRERWTDEEDQLIIKNQLEFGNQWAKVIKRSEGRAKNDTDARWRRGLKRRVESDEANDGRELNFATLVSQKQPAEQSSNADNAGISPKTTMTKTTEQWLAKDRAEDGNCGGKGKAKWGRKPWRWTEEEDELILSSQAKFGNQWAEIGKLLEGRTNNSIEARWHKVLKRKVESDTANDHGELNFATFASQKQPAEQSSDDDNTVINPKSMTTKTTKQWSAKGRAEDDNCGGKDKAEKGWERWTDEEDQLIISSQAKFGNQWVEISKLLEGRTKNSIETRWYRVLKRKVESEEVKDHGELKFATLVSQKQPAELSSDKDNAGINPKTMTTKTTKQWLAKDRAEDGNFGGKDKDEGGREQWTDEEDQLIIKHQLEFGNQWVEISKFLEGRTKNSIEARWRRVLKRKVENDEAKDHGELKFATLVSQKQPAEQSSDEDNAGTSPKTMTTKTTEQWSAKDRAEDGNCGGQGMAKGGRKPWRWTEEEDQLIIKNQLEFGNQWEEISKLLEGRTASTIEARWRRVLKRKVESDEANDHGELKFATLVGQKQPPEQSKDEDNAGISPKTMATKTTWTDEEDQLIIKNQFEFGNQWAKISKLLEGRTKGSIEARWRRVLKRKVESDEANDGRELKFATLVSQKQPAEQSSDEDNAGTSPKTTMTKTTEQLLEKGKAEDGNCGGQDKSEGGRERWTDEEDQLIIANQAEFGNQWDEISKLLEGRTDKSVESRWYGVLKRQVESIEDEDGRGHTLRGWTAEEDDLLLKAVGANLKGDEIQWVDVGMRVPGRTITSCRHRWADLKKNRRWTAEEDNLLCEAANAKSKGGKIYWSQVAMQLTGRTSRSCRKRWLRLKRRAEKNGESWGKERTWKWTVEEDEVIESNCARLRYQWAEISELLDGRTENSVRNRWHQVIKRRVDSDKAEDRRKRKFSTPASCKQPAKHSSDEGSVGASSVTTTAKTTEQRTAEIDEETRSICELIVHLCMSAKRESSDDEDPTGLVEKLFDQFSPLFPKLTPVMIEDGCAQYEISSSSAGAFNRTSEERGRSAVSRVNGNHKSGDESKEEKEEKIEEKESNKEAERDVDCNLNSDQVNGKRKRGDESKDEEEKNTEEKESCWTDKEDDLLRVSVDANSKGDEICWFDVSFRLLGRTEEQCRKRWAVLKEAEGNDDCRGKDNAERWTEEEDRLIILNHAKFGNRWEEISNFLDGRTENCVKNRWYNVLRRRVTRKRKREKEWSSSFVMLTVSPGRLGLTLRMAPSGGAEITRIDPSCSFNGQVEISDHIVTVDGNKVTTIEDVQAGADRVRNIGFFKRRLANEEYCRILMTSNEITHLNPEKMNEKYKSGDHNKEAKVVAITVSPGRLGLTLRTVPAGGAEITNVDPPCPFYGQLQIGDRISFVAGREVRTIEDVLIDSDRNRNILFLTRRRGNDEYCRILSLSEPPPPQEPQFASSANAAGNVVAAPPIVNDSFSAAGYPNLSVLGAIGSGRLAKEKRAELLRALLDYDKNINDGKAQAFECYQGVSGKESHEGQCWTKEEEPNWRDEGPQGNMDAGGGYWC